MIITDRGDNDFYQFTMSQFVWKNFRDWNVRYEFRNRTFAVPLAECIALPELEAQIDAVRKLEVHSWLINWLRATGKFEEEYLNWLRSDQHRLPEVELRSSNGHLVMEYEGAWCDAIFWETMLLSIVSEMYFRRFEALTTEGMRRLKAKLDYLAEHPFLANIEMGSRRRYSAEWHFQTLERWASHPYAKFTLKATSNCLAAHRFAIPGAGTQAHQLHMCAVAAEYGIRGVLPDPIVHPQLKILSMWEQMYGNFPEMMVVLPDTFGTQNLLPCVDLSTYKIVRQDSGDPFQIGQYIVDSFVASALDPKECRVIFSDSLDVRKENVLYDRFALQTQVSFGLGTNWSNDLGFEPLSLVIKPKAVQPGPDADWRGCVKLSDDPAKATGTPEDIARCRRLTGSY